MSLISTGNSLQAASSNFTGTTFFVLPFTSGNGLVIITVGWESPEAVDNPAVIWEGSSALLITTASGNNNTFHLAAFYVPDVTTSFQELSITFDTTVSFAFRSVMAFTGTTAISTATIVTSTGASTLIGTTVRGVAPFSYQFAVAMGTRSSANSSFSVHSSMIQVHGSYPSTTIARVAAYSKSLSEQLVWNSTAESSFVSIGFSLDPEVVIEEVTPDRVALHFLTQVATADVSAAVMPQLLTVILED